MEDEPLLEGALDDYFNAVTLSLHVPVEGLTADEDGLRASLQLEALVVRGLGFQKDLQALSEDLYSPHDDWCLANVGLTVRDAFSVAKAVGALYTAKVSKLRRDAAAVLERARGLLDFVTLYGMRHALAKELSGGQSMLVQIARALMVDPLNVILMDEPFAGVHPTIRDIIMEAILKMNREEAVTFLIVSHEMAELRRLCQRVSVMDDGHLIAEGTLEEVAHMPTVLEAYLGTSAGT
jgi:ABC-type Mn2+/Zn2+ transport system ATPase subunit